MVRRLETPAGIEIVGERPVQRAGDVAGLLVYGFDFAAVTRRRACIDENDVAVVAAALELAGPDDLVTIERCMDVGVTIRFRAAFARHSGGSPRCEPTIEYSSVLVIGKPQQPPEARGCECTVRVVVRDDVRVG